MRLPLIELSRLTTDQRSLYDDMRAGIASSYKGVQTQTNEGALVGPFNPWLHEPDFGKAIWALNRVLVGVSTLPARVREIATLVVGAHFSAAYEVGSHLILAQQTGLTDETIEAIIAGRRPDSLPEPEGCAYDVAAKLCAGGVLPEPLYKLALNLFGERNTSELVYFCGFYAFTCMTLNAYDVAPPVPL